MLPGRAYAVLELTLSVSGKHSSSWATPQLRLRPYLAFWTFCTGCCSLWPLDKPNSSALSDLSHSRDTSRSPAFPSLKVFVTINEGEEGNKQANRIKTCSDNRLHFPTRQPRKPCCFLLLWFGAHPTGDVIQQGLHNPYKEKQTEPNTNPQIT